MSKADGSYVKEMNRIAKKDLLTLDDFGLQTLNAEKRMVFLEIIETTGTGNDPLYFAPNYR
ncbi:MAG: ATP-binding protein [Cyclobacteriaceae bacterium]